MNKRVLTILGGLIALIAIIIGFIVFVSKSRQTSNSTGQSSQSSQSTDQNSQSSSSGQNAQNAQTNQSASKIHRISDVAAMAPALSFDGKSVWFFTHDGHLFKVTLATGLKQEYLLPENLTVDSAVWPVTGDNFIIVTGTGVNKSFHYYDAANKSFITYPQNIKSMDFMNDGSQIAYDFVSGLQSFFSIADKNAKNFQDIAALPSANLQVKVSPTGTRAFAFDDSNPIDGKLNLVDINNKKVVTIGTSMENAAVWSPDGAHFIYNRNPDHKTLNNDLWLGDADSVTNTDIHMESSISKVAFDQSGNNFYVAVPTVDGLSEDIWKINTGTLAKTQVYAPGQTDPKINSSNLLVSDDGTELYFKNSDGYIYSVDTSSPVTSSPSSSGSNSSGSPSSSNSNTNSPGKNNPTGGSNSTDNSGGI